MDQCRVGGRALNAFGTNLSCTAGAGLIKIKTKFSPQLDLAKLELGLSLAKSLS